MRLATLFSLLLGLALTNVCQADLIFDTFGTTQGSGTAGVGTSEFILMEGVGETQWMERTLIKSNAAVNFSVSDGSLGSKLYLQHLTAPGSGPFSATLRYDFVEGDGDSDTLAYQFSGITDHIFYFAESTAGTFGTLENSNPELAPTVDGADVNWTFNIFRDDDLVNVDTTQSGTWLEGDDLVMVRDGEALGAVNRIEFIFSWNGEINGGGGTQPVLGGILFSNANGTAVTPEPASLALCGLGLFGVAGMVVQRRRRTKKEK